VATEKIATSAPYDHFSARPHCRVIEPAIRRVGGASNSPTIRGASSPPIRYCGKRVINA
jgi:hypothetical protein